MDGEKSEEIPSLFHHVRRGLRRHFVTRFRPRRIERLARVLTEPELAYLSRAVFRHRIDDPTDRPQIAAQLDPLISVARMHAKQTVTKSADSPITEERPRDAGTSGAVT